MERNRPKYKQRRKRKQKAELETEVSLFPINFLYFCRYCCLYDAIVLPNQVNLFHLGLSYFFLGTHYPVCLIFWTGVKIERNLVFISLNLFEFSFFASLFDSQECCFFHLYFLFSFTLIPSTVVTLFLLPLNLLEITAKVSSIKYRSTKLHYNRLRICL